MFPQYTHPVAYNHFPDYNVTSLAACATHLGLNQVGRSDISSLVLNLASVAFHRCTPDCLALSWSAGRIVRSV